MTERGQDTVFIENDFGGTHVGQHQQSVDLL